MKNILLKSLVVFIVMSLLNVQFCEWSIGATNLPGGSVGMLPILILIFCLIIIVVGLITVIIFKRNYTSLLKIAILFESLYLLLLVLMRANPFSYFLDKTDENFLNVMLYVNSIIIFLIMYIFNKIYSKMVYGNSDKL
ncbi:hypothetical protein HNP38_002724 [Chryseobacterium defluvii]|uniref:Uncharacterized protein n=1 Tax=Chryseobacterium defluvii TaxID=160396 RepID=A0A840KHC3_9FLAO|nr:hypothetical protein [Chryseobacterium defluvii]